ncbi:hypothetical protein HYE66_02380 [Aggregatibacter actinomycetemcomitans]|nr:hypothetical protein [Aggregatibacter actinomycetemcomitans]
MKTVPLHEVKEFVLKTQNTTISSIQKHFKIGFHHAIYLIEQLEKAGVVLKINKGERKIL